MKKFAIHDTNEEDPLNRRQNNVFTVARLSLMQGVIMWHRPLFLWFRVSENKFRGKKKHGLDGRVDKCSKLHREGTCS